MKKPNDKVTQIISSLFVHVPWYCFGKISYNLCKFWFIYYSKVRIKVELFSNIWINRNEKENILKIRKFEVLICLLNCSIKNK